MSRDQLVARFAEIGEAQSAAELMGRTAEFNKLFNRMITIEDELKQRDGDQRRALVALFVHPNMQVRLNAAKAVRPVEPDVARQQLEKIAASRHYPQAGDAGMSLWAWDEGIYRAE